MSQALRETDTIMCFRVYRRKSITASFIIYPVIVWHYIIHPVLLTLWYRALPASLRPRLPGSGVATTSLAEEMCRILLLSSKMLLSADTRRGGGDSGRRREEEERVQPACGELSQALVI